MSCNCPQGVRQDPDTDAQTCGPHCVWGPPGRHHHRGVRGGDHHQVSPASCGPPFYPAWRSSPDPLPCCPGPSPGCQVSNTQNISGGPIDRVQDCATFGQNDYPKLPIFIIRTNKNGLWCISIATGRFRSFVGIILTLKPYTLNILSYIDTETQQHIAYFPTWFMLTTNTKEWRHIKLFINHQVINNCC